MRVFLINYSRPMEIDIARRLRAGGVEIAYWLGAKEYYQKLVAAGEFSGTVFHSTYDAINGAPAPGIDPAQFPPADKQLIEELGPYESAVLDMMEGFDHFHMPLLKKQHLYYTYLRYWQGVLKTFKPDAVLFADIPHTPYNFVIYHLARKNNIKTVLYKHTKGIVGRLLFFEDFTDYRELQAAYASLLKQGFRLDNLSAELRTYYAKHRDPQADNTLYYRKTKYLVDKAKQSDILPRWSTIVRHLRQLTLWSTTYKYLRMMFIKVRLIRFERQFTFVWQERILQYRRNRIKKRFHAEFKGLVEDNPDLAQKFVYVPLHFQPECATNPQGNIFKDQILMLETLSYALPPGWVIYAKENEIQWSWPRGYLGRYPGYYQTVAANKNIRLISPRISTFTLMEKAQAVATVTGTAGWEAVMRGTPALLFGHTWYNGAEGVFTVSGVADCRSVFEKIARGYAIDQGKVVTFLGALQQVAVAGYPSKRYKGDSAITESESARNISEKILHILGPHVS
ncbi:MAG: Capsule polysaccharide export protein [Candidatus Magasanikbacteria bacterium GW2011_GWA2_56_11]|uniref:Capsule polysaccharide export protein n=1 Tax=Candidatus Magasanikbacteria bacterium GW2011_GWA2_56_11 TaxID=1619044 RepID=A0A0G1YGN3_9BACT|nr:MAG: Capsule polysaccharide export protein [Candidatus Magasanikbacteria bacterium GW2011_GWA2_56_11]